MKNQAIFIGATGQNVGKTTLSLGILSLLKKRFGEVGFLKPVGQQHVPVIQGSETINVDKDVVLFKEYFQLKSSYKTMSPVLCPQGFTKDYLDKKICNQTLTQSITSSFHDIRKEHPYVLVEGTGHIGVGSIFDLSNAKVARILGLDMVIIANAGLGSSFDELTLHIEMCLSQNIRVRGVILNRVLEDKRSMLQHYFPKALERYNIPVIGYIPFLSDLSVSSIKNIPTLYTPSSSFDAMKHIRAHAPKICKEDTAKVQKAIQLVEPHIDLDLLLK